MANKIAEEHHDIKNVLSLHLVVVVLRKVVASCHSATWDQWLIRSCKSERQNGLRLCEKELSMFHILIMYRASPSRCHRLPSRTNLYLRPIKARDCFEYQSHEDEISVYWQKALSHTNKRRVNHSVYRYAVHLRQLVLVMWKEKKTQIWDFKTSDHQFRIYVFLLRLPFILMVTPACSFFWISLKMLF